MDDFCLELKSDLFRGFVPSFTEFYRVLTEFYLIRRWKRVEVADFRRLPSFTGFLSCDRKTS